VYAPSESILRYCICCGRPTVAARQMVTPRMNAVHVVQNRVAVHSASEFWWVAQTRGLRLAGAELLVSESTEMCE